MVVTTTVVESVIRTNFRWLPLTAPEELSSFAWTIDGKQLAPTKMERLWSKICLPWLQSRSLNEPLITITEGDFSYLPADVARELPEAPRAPLGPQFSGKRLRGLVGRMEGRQRVCRS